MAQALYRKWRPQTWEDVIGQGHIVQTLRNAIAADRVAHAYLFAGPRGTGKTTTARLLAKAVNCLDETPANRPCNHCDPCQAVNEARFWDLIEIDAASNTSVDDVRALRDKINFSPNQGTHKVYIIDEVHMLSASAFNAFLKTLEEPPAYAKFILATTEKHKILPTILSRCQIFDFKRITVDDIAGHLHHVAGKEHITAEDNALHIIAQKADGAMRDALSIFDQLVSFAGNNLTYVTVLENLNVLDYEYFFKITEQILCGDISGTLLTINDIIDKGFEGQHFLIGFGEHLRNLLVCKDAATARLLETAPSIRNHYVEQSGRCPIGLLLSLLDMNNRCDLNYKTSNNKRLHLELTLMQMCAPMMGQEKLQSPPAVAHPMPTPAAPPPSSIPAPPVPAKEQSPPIQESTKPAESIPLKKPAETVKMRDIKNDFTSTTSIKQPLSKTTNPELTDEEDLARSEIATPFTQADLFRYWDEYAEKLKNDSPHLYSTLKSSRPVVEDDWVIGFSIDNKVMDDELTVKKTEMMEFLRNNLNNFKIQLHTRIAETQKTLKPYTDKEKFELMATKNPALKNLREELDLEIEY
jgi:DNA polymerase-3 subunit gamma/tau